MPDDQFWINKIMIYDNLQVCDPPSGNYAQISIMHANKWVSQASESSAHVWHRIAGPTMESSPHAFHVPTEQQQFNDIIRLVTTKCRHKQEWFPIVHSLAPPILMANKLPLS